MEDFEMIDASSEYWEEIIENRLAEYEDDDDFMTRLEFYYKYGYDPDGKYLKSTSYWNELVEEEHECGGCGYTTKITRREYYNRYEYEPGGRKPGYERNKTQNRITLEWYDGPNRSKEAKYLEYFTVTIPYEPYWKHIELTFYNPEYDEMDTEHLESDSFTNTESMIKYAEEYLADETNEMLIKLTKYVEKYGKTMPSLPNLITPKELVNPLRLLILD